MDIDIEAATDSAGRRVLDVAGAIDVQSREALIAMGRKAFKDGAPGLVLDLADVTFIDSTGIGALIELGHDAEDAESTLVLRDPSSRVLRILEMTGLDEAWAVEAGSR